MDGLKTFWVRTNKINQKEQMTPFRKFLHSKDNFLDEKNDKGHLKISTLHAKIVNIIKLFF